MRRRMAAAAVGLVLLMTTGCSAAAAPTGDALYRAGAERVEEFANGLHSSLMAVHEGTWMVGQLEYGALPILCAGGEDYSFHAIRNVTLEGADADALTARMVTALEDLDLEVTSQVFGSGDDEQRSVVGTGGVFERITFTLRPANGLVRLSASSTCAPGRAHELADMVFDNSVHDDQWRLLPATEGPDSTPQFFFPADGPVYYDESRAPVDPQPVVTELPVAPYGG